MDNELLKQLGFIGVMISGSKSGYRDRYPKNLAVFNANVCTESSGIIWWGDIDVTIKKNILIEIAIFRKETIYVLYEMDGRFENTANPLIHKYIIKFEPDGTYQLKEQYKEYYKL